jgi:hypothetical protein
MTHKKNDSFDQENKTEDSYSKYAFVSFGSYYLYYQG